MNQFLRFLLALCCYSTSTALAESFFKEGVPQFTVQKEGADTVSLPRFSVLAKELSPSVVNISVEGEVLEHEAEGEPEGKEPKEKEGQNPFRSLGSGFIVSDDGYIVTSNHVVDKSDNILVRLLNDKTEYKAKVIGKDKKTDLALLKIEPHGKLSVTYLGDSDKLEVGDWVLAIGNQFELGQTVTAGIVSAKSRRVPSKNSGPYDAFIQTDASINPGSSGGPLFNTAGQVIGVNTAIFTPTRGQFAGGPGFNIGIGFAIPVNLVKQVVNQLKSQGKVTRGLLGVLIQKIDNDLAQAMKLSNTDGALVAEVMKESPAGKAGIEVKDIITSFDGKPIHDYEDLPLFVANAAVGATVKLSLIRGGAEKTVDVKIEELKEETKAKEEKPKKPDMIGMTVEAVTEDIMRAAKLSAVEGVIVASVEPGSAAERAGIGTADIILEIGGAKITNLASYSDAIKALKKGAPTLFFVKKRDGARFLAVTPK